MDIDEKRVYADRTGKRDVHVATGVGIATVAVSAAQVGGFSLAHQCTARDVATGDGLLVAATDEDVLLGRGFEPTEFGPAVAVTVHEGRPLAAGPDGRLARLDGSGWTTLATLPEVRALSGDLAATAEGVYRVTGEHAGLDDATDVTTAGLPRAATGSALYRLGNGWMHELDGAFTTVASAPDGRAHAATDETLYARDPGARPEDADAWAACDLPVAESVVGVGYGECPYAVTAAGTFLARDPETGWTDQALGLPDVAGLAVSGTQTETE